MKHRVLWLLLVLFACAVASSAQNPQQLFTQALTQERAAGNLEQAIDLYQRVAKDTTDRALAAQALINAARAYDKLGQTQASRSLYTQVARVYPEQQQQADTARQRLSETGTIEGTVKRAESGEPIKGAQVALSGGPADPDALRELLAFYAQRGVIVSPPANGEADERFFQGLTDAAAARGVSMVNPVSQEANAAFEARNDSRFKSLSDDEGHFIVKDLPPGKYRIRAQREGFFAPPVTAPAEYITVVAGRTSLVDVPLLSGGTISGRVTDDSGQPQTNVNVQAYSTTYRGGFPVLQAAISKQTDDRGEYRLFWLPDGEYIIAASPRNATLLGGTTGNGTPQQSPNSFQPSSTHRIYFPGTGDISMTIPVVVQRGNQVAGIDIGLRRVPTFRISGVIHSHMPVLPVSSPGTLGANLDLSTRDTSVPEEMTTAPGLGIAQLRQAGSEYIGQFTINGVTPGAYDLKTFADEWGPDGVRRFAFASAPVDVFNQDVSGVVLHIYPTVVVRGAVTVDGRPPGTDTVRISLQVEGSNAKRPSYQGLASRAVIAGSQDGAFTIPNAPAGRFRIQPGAGLPANLYIENVLYAGQTVFDSGFDVGRDEVKGLQVIVRSGAGVIEGTVKDSAGKLIAGATAVLVPPVARRQNRALYRTATSDPAGRFKIQGIAPGNYDLFAWQTVPDGAYYNTRFLSRYQDRARPVRVGQSTTTSNQDLVALPAVGR